MLGCIGYTAYMSISTDSTFLPAAFDPADWSQVQPLIDELRQRDLSSVDALHDWLADASALADAMGEAGSRANIDHARDTSDTEAEQRYLHFIERIQPQLSEAFFHLQRKFLDCPYRDELTGERFDVLRREWEADVALFRPDNIPLNTELTKLFNQYNQRCGAMTVEYDEREQTLPQLAVYAERNDRAVREETWRLAADRRLEDREAFDDLFEQQLQLRQQVAENAGFEDFRVYIWQDKHRFDYTPQDCLDFADAVAEVVVPAIEQLDRERMQAMGLNALRPWDLSVDPRGRPALEPFDPADVEQLVADTRQLFERLSPVLAEQFRQLKMGENLDLDNRRGKHPGGFQAALPRSKQPFIFMNAVGVQRDVDTLLHEAGHAFHFLESVEHEPLNFIRHASLEFCEVASMSMELLGCDHYDVFYDDPADAARAKRKQLEGALRVLPWIATIDSFQHWLYTNPGHSRAERYDAWLSIHDRFSSTLINWSGLAKQRKAMWHRQLHLFGAPFYYIEYGIAQLGALQVWRNSQRDAARTLDQLTTAFRRGGGVPLPTLFQTAGIHFDFRRETMEPLVETTLETLEQLPV